MPGAPHRVIPPTLRGIEHPSMAGWLRLASSGWYVKAADAVADPDTLDLAVADSVWFFAMEDWQRRRPIRRHLWAWHVWRAEERRLAAEQAQLVARTLAKRIQPSYDPKG
ncbi:MAG TPA: hypothetical protein VKB75_15500 [Jatrophihabitans sp.]|nr:hypothetical protein [Jatrophihabitans sp.]